MWFYLEFALFVFGFFYAYRAGWNNGWHAAFAVARATIQEAKRLKKIQELNPERSTTEDHNNKG